MARTISTTRPSVPSNRWRLRNPRMSVDVITVLLQFDIEIENELIRVARSEV